MDCEHDEVDSLTGETHNDPEVEALNRRQANANRAGGQMNVSISSPVGMAGAIATQAGNPTNNQANSKQASHDNEADANPYANLNISRNAPCPCGSGLKYKQCHGKI